MASAINETESEATGQQLNHIKVAARVSSTLSPLQLFETFAGVAIFIVDNQDFAVVLFRRRVVSQFFANSRQEIVTFPISVRMLFGVEVGQGPLELSPRQCGLLV